MAMREVVGSSMQARLICLLNFRIPLRLGKLFLQEYFRAVVAVVI